MHMPRAVGVFRKAGWTVVPYPVDYVTDGRAGVSFGFAPAGGLGTLGTAMHEWIGLFAYWLLDRTDRIFPGPETGSQDAENRAR